MLLENLGTNRQHDTSHYPFVAIICEWKDECFTKVSGVCSSNKTTLKVLGVPL